MTETPSTPRIVLYWRPGCSYCSRLVAALDRVGVDRIERNIWDDPAAAAFVRANNRGNETVPTVEIDGTVLVNPSADEVVSAARRAGVPLPS